MRVTPRDEPLPADATPALAGGGRRMLWHAFAMLLAAALAWLVFTAYRQPDFILEFAGMRLC